MQDRIPAEISAPPPPAALAWVARQVGAKARVEAWARLEGGTACALHAIDVADARGARHPLVLKRFVQRDWLEREPDLAAREARHLRRVEALPFPTPRVCGVDPDGLECDVPALLMSRLPGRPVLDPPDREAWLRSLAGPLVVLHARGREMSGELQPYRAFVELEELDLPTWSGDPTVWRRILDRVRGAPPGFAERPLHRDYHPTNLLWSAGRVTGVLDFTNMARGPVDADLAHCRKNLALLLGSEVADRFSAVYRGCGGADAEPDPYWDMLSLVETLPGPPRVYAGWTRLGVPGLTPELMRSRLEDYAARLVARLDS